MLKSNNHLTGKCNEENLIFFKIQVDKA